MPKRSAGLLMYRHRGQGIQVFLMHPGGPLWTHKDVGAWSVPKGEYTESEAPLAAAQREFREETSYVASGPFLPLAPIRQSSGKILTVWAFQGDCDAMAMRSNTFMMEWPPHSGHQHAFPEVDRAAWFDLASARQKIVPGQRGFLDDLQQQLREHEQ